MGVVRVIVEFASVSSSGVLELPMRIREILGVNSGARVVLFADPETKRVVLVREAGK